MSQVPRELIRQVQICTRSAAGLSDYNPSDPTLPALPPLSAAIAASDHPSPPQIRCKNCKGMLLRGSESIICVYCGLGPHYDVVPDPISFTSTIGYHWLLRSLRLDGSEMVDPTNGSEQNQGYNSPKTLTPLSDFLRFKIPWPAEIEKQETTFSEKQSQQSEGSLRLTGVAPDKFFLKSKKNVLSDLSNSQPFTHNQIGTVDGKDVAAVGNQNLFHNVQSSEPAGSSFKHKSGEAFSEWEADFQSADSENQPEFPGASVDSENNFKDPKSFDLSTGLGVNLAADIDSVFGPGKDLNDGKPEDNPAVSPAFDDSNSTVSENQREFPGASVDSENNFKDPKSFDPSSTSSGASLAAHIDSVFGSGKDLNDGKPEDNPAVSPALDDWNSDDVWNNLSSNNTTVSTKNDTEVDHTLLYSMDSSADLFQDFQSQTNYTDKTENKPTSEEHKTMDEDLFEEWNDFTGSTSLQFPSQNAWTGGDYQASTSDQKSSEMDLFSFDNKSEKGDFGSFSQQDLFSTSPSNRNPTTEVNAVMSESSASDWLFDASGPSHESGQAANDGGTSGKSTEEDVRMLISQMHDLSFMLETNLCIPSAPDTSNSS